MILKVNALYFTIKFDAHGFKFEQEIVIFDELKYIITIEDQETKCYGEALKNI